jgi:hypothetical protein
MQAADGAQRVTRWVSGEFTLVLPPQGERDVGSSIRGSRVPVNHTAVTRPRPNVRLVARPLRRGKPELVHQLAALRADFRAFIDTTYPIRRNDSLDRIGRPSYFDMHERGTAVSWSLSTRAEINRLRSSSSLP